MWCRGRMDAPRRSRGVIAIVVEEDVDVEDDVVEAIVDETPHRFCQA